MNKELRAKVRAMGILALLRGILQGRSDGEIEWIFNKGRDDRITATFKVNMVDTDIVVLQNLSSKKVASILGDARKLMKKHCKLWDKRWWKKLGKQGGIK